MTGQLVITNVCRIDATASPAIVQFSQADKLRWQIFGSAPNEVGGDSGSDLRIFAMDDAGLQLHMPLEIKRSTGQLSFGTINNDGGVPTYTNAQVTVNASPATNAIGIRAGAGPGNRNFAIAFLNSTSVLSGNIEFDDTTTYYNATSDARLKEDAQPFDAGPIIDQLNVYDFQWIATGERAHGVVAQEAVEVYPEAISHNVEEDWWGVDYSKYVPLLLNEIKALRARVAALEAAQP